MTTPVADLFARRMSQVRRAFGLTQADLGVKCGMSRSTIAKIESRSRNVTLDEAWRISEALNVVLLSLLSDDLEVVVRIP